MPARARPVPTGGTTQERLWGAGGAAVYKPPVAAAPTIQTLAHFACSRLPRATLVSPALVSLAPLSSRLLRRPSRALVPLLRRVHGVLRRVRGQIRWVSSSISLLSLSALNLPLLSQIWWFPPSISICSLVLHL